MDKKKEARAARGAELAMLGHKLNMICDLGVRFKVFLGLGLQV